MFGSFLANLGAKVGRYFGGGMLSTIGKYVGGYAGKYLDNYLQRKWFHKKQVFHKYSNLRESFALSMARPGGSIALVFGRARVPGKIIWTDEIKNTATTTSSSKYFTMPKQVKSTTHHTEYKYFLSFAVCICEGEIEEVSRIWNGDELIDIKNYKFRFYKGSRSQMPDPYIQAKMDNQASAFRDLAYIFFEDLPLADFGDVIPNFSFEVIRKANVVQSNMVEDLVKSMIMIPGSGEYVYDTVIQKKQIVAPNGSIKGEKVLNSHNLYNLPNSIHSLNQLKSTCKNVEWVAPVVCWFANSMDLRECLIRPAVEFRDPGVRFSQPWQVGEFTRDNAPEIGKDINGNPRYGGSINDQSVVRYLQELKSRGLRVMFYPMFFMDIDRKPWRGRLTGNPEDVRDFFRKRYGYNEFILHYANLVRNHVDAFIIGTELIGLTQIKDHDDNFPAVEELVRLARLVKGIVGGGVQVSYAADWSEYHHTEGGWFNLDLLWASEHIDFIGIDAYFPITATVDSFITNKDIKDGFASGEGYDYCINAQRHKTPIEPIYAWKNLKYWWENTHPNPNGVNSPWQPRSKRIWFTEYGFPSIDKASNQPNVFFDPLCLDGGVPRNSNAETDFSIQRRSIRAFIEFWSAEEYIENMFLWTWDARPYPAWPHMDIWKDGYLWEKGHWVSDKFGICSVASIILEISSRCKIDIRDVETVTIDEAIGGVIFTNQISGKDAINTIRTAYFFDISASNGQKISFVKRGVVAPVLVNYSDLIKLQENSYINEIEIAKEEILSKIDIYFQNQLQDYETHYVHVNNEENSNLKTMVLRLPMVLSPSEACKIGKLLIKNAASETKILEFNLPISYLDLEPSDFIYLDYERVRYSLRIINITIMGLVVQVIAIIDNINNYHNTQITRSKDELFYRPNIETDFQLIELPFNQPNCDFPHILIYFNNATKLLLEAKPKRDLVGGWNRVTMLKPTNSITKIINFDCATEPNFFLVDERSTIQVRGVLESVHFNDNNWKLAEVNGELIAFKNIKKLATESEVFIISCLIRGVYGTEKRAANHAPDSTLTIISKAPNIIPIAEDLINQELEFRVNSSLIKEIRFVNKAALPDKPIITGHNVQDGTLRVRWLNRDFKSDGWSKRQLNRNIHYTITITARGQGHNFVGFVGRNEAEINIGAIDISEGYNIDIMYVSFI